MEKPARLGLPGARSRFDELQAIHQLQAYATHFVVSEESPKTLGTHDA
jgi:tyrosinase